MPYNNYREDTVHYSQGMPSNMETTVSIAKALRGFRIAAKTIVVGVSVMVGVPVESGSLPPPPPRRMQHHSLATERSELIISR